MDLWDAILRGGAAIVWIVAAARVIHNRGALNGDAFRRMLATLSLAFLLTVIALGPFLVNLLGSVGVRTLYTATATVVLIVGLAFATVRPH